jgi:hypothetical protein
MGNRSRTGNKRKKLEQKVASQAALILSMPSNCKVCNEPFDKKNKMMVMSWYVEVFNAEKRVDLYCPKCSEPRRKDAISRDTGV